MRWKLVLTGMSLGLILLAIQLLVAQATNPSSLAGSWQLTLTPVSPFASLPVPIQSLATFTSDGSVIETDATEVIPMMNVAGTAVYATPGHGVWQPGPAVGNFTGNYGYELVDPTGHVIIRGSGTVTGEKIPHPLLP